MAKRKKSASAAKPAKAPKKTAKKKGAKKVAKKAVKKSAAKTPAVKKAAVRKKKAVRPRRDSASKRAAVGTAKPRKSLIAFSNAEFSVGQKPPEEVSVAVTFRRTSDNLGLVKLESLSSAQTLSQFVPDDNTIARTKALFAEHGFQIATEGKLSMVVRGPRGAYEKLFGTKLEPMAMDARVFTRFSAPGVYFPPPQAPWNPQAGVEQLIDEAYIQWPHIYMNQRFAPPPEPSLVPPQVNYHHLRIPGDVVALLNAARAHRQGVTGRGVRVAMIDSGFNHSHAYFREMGYNVSTVLASPGATNVGKDGNGHGTSESGNLLAIAPDVEFIGVKLDNDSGGAGASVLEGLQTALAQNPQIISVSLGYDLCPTDASGDRTSNAHLTQLPNSLKALEAEVKTAVANGVVIVFSAGNGHVAFPGMMPEIISAGGVYVDEKGQMSASDYASAFSSKIYPGRHVPDFCGLVGMVARGGSYIMLPAQAGCEIDSDVSAFDGTGNKDGWCVISGTSAAAPQLAGVCALLLQKNPGLTPSEVKQILHRTCRDVVLGRASDASNEGNPGVAAGAGDDGGTGAGLVDAFAALQQA